MTGKPMNAN